MLRSITIFSFFALATVLVIVLQPGPRSSYGLDYNENALHETSRNHGGVLQEQQALPKLEAPDEVISKLKAGTQSQQPLTPEEPSSDASTGSLPRLQAALNASLDKEAPASDIVAESNIQPVTQAVTEPSRTSAPVPVQAVAPELRDMSWQTLNALNGLGHASKGPGQEGSLLNSIVRRSMGQVGSAPKPLPQAAVRAKPALVAPVQQNTVSSNSAKQNYVVASGDTLALIAIKLYGSALATDKLLSENPSLRQNPNALRIGQVLKYSTH